MKTLLGFTLLCAAILGCSASAPQWQDDPNWGVPDADSSLYMVGASPRYRDDIQAGRHFAIDAAIAEIAAVLNQEATLLDIKRAEYAGGDGGGAIKRSELERFATAIVRGARPIQYAYDPATNTEYVLVKVDLSASARLNAGIAQYTQKEQERINELLKQTEDRLKERRKEFRDSRR